ncbi:hypothetical protein ACFQU1_01625 [Chelatococcus sp. GCM10030263]|uniref:hypothetical protein n=1 Tax=Chelatococcus sp. GCM10030263 TaxID=3273387 RepID=UPI0036193FF6
MSTAGMQSFVRTGLVAVGLAAVPLTLATAPAIAATPYDGAWRVEVVTQAGTCDRVHGYNLRVVNGRIEYDRRDSALEFSASGNVDRRGRVAVTIVRGADRVNARGQLSGNDGTGSWTLPARGCSGRWQAIRRGA